MNSHQRLVTQHWRANSDIRLILTLSACVDYIAKYASKDGEEKSAEMIDVCKTMLNHVDANEPNTSKITTKMMMKLASQRDSLEGDPDREQSMA